MKNKKFLSTLLSLIFAISIFLVSCGTPKYPKADFEADAENISVYLLTQLAVMYDSPDRDRLPSLVKEHRHKVIRVKGKAEFLKGNKSDKETVIALGSSVERLKDVDLHVLTYVTLKGKPSPEIEKKIANKETIVIQGILKDQFILTDNVFALGWKIDDAIVIENGEFNTDKKANQLVEEYIGKFEKIAKNQKNINKFINSASTSIINDGNSILIPNRLRTKSNNPTLSEYVQLNKTSNTEFYRYISGRYGYTIRVPAFMTNAEESINGNETTFSSPDEQIQLFTSCYPAVSSLDKEYEKALVNRNRTTGKKDPFTAKGSTWFVVTWETNDIAHYQKTFVKNGLETTMHYSYPKALRPTHSRYIDAIEEDFRPGR